MFVSQELCGAQMFVFVCVVRECFCRSLLLLFFCGVLGEGFRILFEMILIASGITFRRNRWGGSSCLQEGLRSERSVSLTCSTVNQCDPYVFGGNQCCVGNRDKRARHPVVSAQRGLKEKSHRPGWIIMF